MGSSSPLSLHQPPPPRPARLPKGHGVVWREVSHNETPRGVDNEGLGPFRVPGDYPELPFGNTGSNAPTWTTEQGLAGLSVSAKASKERVTVAFYTVTGLEPVLGAVLACPVVARHEGLGRGPGSPPPRHVGPARRSR